MANTGSIEALKAEVNEFIRANGQGRITGPIHNHVLTDTIDTLDALKQGVIEDLEAIREGAAAGATAYQLPEGGVPKRDLSEGVQDSLNKADDAAVVLEAIQALIPTQASPENQLADKDFVNSSVSTATATYRGNYNLVTDLGLTVAAIEAQIAAALALVVPVADNNDYAFVQIPTSDATPAEIARIDRYKYNGEEWAFEYALNNSGYTAAQWAAINSGITGTLVTKLAALPTAQQIADAIAAKADKPASATAGHVAGLDADGNLMDTGIAAEDIALKDGSYDGLTAGKAKQLTGADAVEAEYTFEALPSGIGKGYAQMQRILGNSIVWNQLVQNGDFSDGTTGWSKSGAAVISAADNVLTWTTADTTTSQKLNRQVDFVNGHKYYLAFDIKGDTGNKVTGGLGQTGGGGLFGSIAYSAAWERIARIVAPATVNSFSLYLRPNADGLETQTTYFRNIIVLDLTLMFGEGKEPSTVEDFVKLYWQDYYAYNGGVIKNNEVTAIDTVGFNQWDEEWEVGSLDANTGAKTVDSARIRTKNYIPVFPNTNYFLKLGSVSGTLGTVVFYDTEKNYIGRVFPSAGTAFISPANAAYILIAFYPSYGTTYNHDICINLSDPSRNGTYEPYRKDTVLLPVTTVTGKLNGEGASVTVLPNGPASAGAVRDEVYFDRIVKRVGSVDLGTLTWTMSGDIGFEFFYASLNGSNTRDSILSPKYAIGTVGQSTGSDKSITYLTTKQLRVRDLTYTSAADFTAAMDGVMLNFELATPEVYILDTPLDLAYFVAPGGTQARIPADTENDVLAPMLCEVTYPANDANTLERLNANFEGRGGLATVLDALVAAGVISAYTLAYDPASQKYACTVTP